MQTFLKIFSVACLAVFVIFAALQFNDPDPLVWMFAYLLPAYIAFSAFRNQFNQELIIATAFGALLGAITFFPYGHYEGVALKDGMKTIEIETARESFGLAIVFATMVIFFLQKKIKNR